MLSFYRVAMWCLFWAVVWPIALLWKKATQENCLTWAFKQWDEKPEGYIVIRWSRSNKYPWMKWPHFLFIDPGNDKDMRHLLPKNATDLEKHTVPAVWFEGTITERDQKKQGFEN